MWLIHHKIHVFVQSIFHCLLVCQSFNDSLDQVPNYITLVDIPLLIFATFLVLLCMCLFLVLRFPGIKIICDKHSVTFTSAQWFCCCCRCQISDCFRCLCVFIACVCICQLMQLRILAWSDCQLWHFLLLFFLSFKWRNEWMKNGLTE